MARNLIPSDTTIKAVRPGDPRRRLSDGGGLFLLLYVKGGAHGWRFDYHFAGKRKMLSLGTYPDTSLAIARRKADAARALVAQGLDPSRQRKADKVAQIEAQAVEQRKAQGLPPLEGFETIAREWFAVKRGGWGVEAEATRQASRGELRRFQALWQLKAGGDGRLAKPREAEKAGDAARPG